MRSLLNFRFDLIMLVLFLIVLALLIYNDIEEKKEITELKEKICPQY